MDFYKEYSRLRSIARKRIERASAAGYGEYIKLPTVKQIRASENPNVYMNAVREFLGGEYSTLTAAKKSGQRLDVERFQKLPPAPKVRKLSTEEKQARRKEQKRRSRAKRAVEKAAATEAMASKQVGYLKALETVATKWREHGVDIGNWLGILSPAKAKAFVAYVEYRFSQGDYKNRYTIDTFIRDFGELVKRNYDFKDIQTDFNTFLAKQKTLRGNMRQTKKYGITEDEIDTAWRMFVRG